MSTQRSSYWPLAILIVGALALIVALPTSWKPWAPKFLKPEVHLGLDLAGGTQLDFRIDESDIVARKQKIDDEINALKKETSNQQVVAKQVELQSLELQHTNIVEAIRNVLERRINSLGVSEATITPSYFGTEKHLLVECPGIIDVNRCIATVGKTIRLEFKEEYQGSPEEYENGIRAKANTVFKAVTQGTGSLQVYGQDLSSTLGVSYFDSRPMFVSDLKRNLAPLAKRKTTDPAFKVEDTIQTVGQNAQGQPEIQEIKGIYIAKLLQEPKPAERTLENPPDALAELQKRSPSDMTLEEKNRVEESSLSPELKQAFTSMELGSVQVVSLGQDAGTLYLSGKVPGMEEMTASHILVQYKGAVRADAGVTRTKDQALARANDLKKRLTAGESVATLAKAESDGPSKGQAGSLGVLRPNVMVPAFDKVAFTLTQGQISDVVETPFGYHIIRADQAVHTSPSTISYTLLRIKGANALDKAKALVDQVQKGEVKRTENQVVMRAIFFSLVPTGWRDTTLNGERFLAASVSADPVTNIPVVQIQFDEEGGKMFQELTKRNIDKRIAIFVGGDLVSAPTVQAEIAGGNAVITGSSTLQEAQTLAQDLNTGAIPAPIYLSGQSTIEATLGASALHQSVKAAVIGMLILFVMMLVLYRALGLMANVALMFYVILLVAALKLPLLLISNTTIVLTLAGIAGIILSMGMAVDANILAFERTKEELRKGKSLKTSIDTGFKRAWPSVRDGNSSTLITCAILFIIGTSIIRGFSITLAMGIFISLFTAMIVSRWLALKVASSPLGERLELFGVRKDEVKKE